MQRRAAAVYFAFFVLVGAGAYGMIATTPAAEVSLDAPSYGEDATFDVGGQTYTVAGISVEEAEGGHGGSATVTGELAWTNESAVYTATLENNSTVDYQGEERRVLIANESDVSEFTLRETQNVSAILAADAAVENETVGFQGQPHVVYRANDTLRPLAEYLPTPAETSVAEGEEFVYENNSTTVDAVTPAEVTLTWSGERRQTVGLDEGANVTLSGQQFVVHFPSESAVQLGSDYGAYQEELDRVDYAHERTNGLWGVAILSFMAAAILLGAAYMPVRG